MSYTDKIPWALLAHTQNAIEHTFDKPCIDCGATEKCKHRPMHQAYEAIKAALEWSEKEEANLPKAAPKAVDSAEKIWVDCDDCEGEGGHGGIDDSGAYLHTCDRCEGRGEVQVDAPRTLFVMGLRSAWDGIFKEIEDERVAQFDKWGVQRHDWPRWMSILGEEYGEAAREANWSFWSTVPVESAGHRHGLREELIQTIAVAVAMVEHIDEVDEQEDNNVYASPE